MALPPTPEINALTEKIIGCAMRVHSGLGPGLLESVYKAAMAAELSEADLRFEIEVPLPVQYRDRHLPCGFRMDIVVEHSVVLEIKSVAKLANIHRAQGVTYLRLSGCQAGLILNFN